MQKVKVKNKNLILVIACFLVTACLPVVAYCEQAPEEIWSRKYNRGWGDQAKSLCVDKDGNIYVTGYSNNGSNNDLTIIKYNPNGIPIWVKNIDKGGIDEGYDIKIDKYGYLYVVGSTERANLDGFIVKLDTAGNIIWEQAHNIFKGDKFSCLDFDDTGNLYVCGYCNEVALSKDFLVSKYNSTGETLQWVSEYKYDSGNADEAKALAVASDGFLYVTGISDNKMLTVKIDSSSGNTVWMNTYPGIGGSDRGNDIAISSDKNIVVVGYTKIAAADNCVIVVYHPDSHTIWTQTVEKGEAYNVTVDQSGYIYFSGESRISADYDWLIAKYTSSGSLLWTKNYNSGGKDGAPDLKTDASGYIYLTGYSNNGVTDDFLTIKYSTVPGILPPQSTGEVRIGSTGKQGIVYPLKGDKAIIAVKPTTAGKIVVKIYTLTGNYVIDNVFDVFDPLDSSKNYWLWDCYNKQGSPVVSGAYIVYVEGPGIRVSKKVIIIR